MTFYPETTTTIPDSLNNGLHVRASVRGVIDHYRYCFATYRGGLSPDPGSWSPNVQKSRYAVVVRAFESNSPHMYMDPIST